MKKRSEENKRSKFGSIAKAPSTSSKLLLHFVETGWFVSVPVTDGVLNDHIREFQIFLDRHSVLDLRIIIKSAIIKFPESEIQHEPKRFVYELFTISVPPSLRSKCESLPGDIEGKMPYDRASVSSHQDLLLLLDRQLKREELNNGLVARAELFG